MKKILAMVLSLAMVISLIPAAFASGEEGENTSGDLTYVFNAGAYGEKTALDITALAELDAKETFATNNTAEWRLTGKYYINEIELGEELLTLSVKESRLKNGPVAAFELKTVPGAYNVSLFYDALTSGCTVDVCLVPKTELVKGKIENGSGLNDNNDIGNVVDQNPSCKVGTVDMYGTADGDFEEEPFGEIVLTESEYYLLISCNGKNANTVPVVTGTRVHAKIHSLVLEKIEDDSELTNAFTPESITENAVAIPENGVTVNTYVYTVDGEKKNLDESITVPAGEACTVDASKITGMDGYEFLYWAKGATMDKKQIVSDKTEYTFIPTVEATHLIAVFAPKNATATGSAKAEFYNGNGQLLPDFTVTSGENVEIPELPSMAGYGNATHWELYGDNEKYNPGSSVALSGNMIFVAQYPDLKKDIKITVIGGICNKDAYRYGGVVICKPDDPENFKCWKKDGVIVSIDKEYEFNAWESCVVEAITGEYVFNGKATKLLIDIFNDKIVMAEFIGLSNYGTVVEKGIMIENKRFAMQMPLATQFTLEAENKSEAKKAVAYAIFADGTMITGK